MSWQIWLPLPLFMLPALSAAAQPPVAGCERHSPAHTVALVELYTSEGCSSCPPADRWLSALAQRDTGQRVLPLSLHVGYWDDLGWRDPFAQPSFSERQERLARRGGSRQVYTPGVFVAAGEVRNWRDEADFRRRIESINRLPPRADIRLAMRPAGKRSVAVEARIGLSSGVGGNLQAVLMVYEDRLVSAVGRGENRGETLRHDRVVRRWLPQALTAGAHTMQVEVPLPAEWNAANLGLAAFVEDVRSGEVLQAASLPFCLPA